MTPREAVLLTVLAVLALGLCAAAWWMLAQLQTLVELITIMLDIIDRSGATWNW